jgi:hypothetical protein
MAPCGHGLCAEFHPNCAHVPDAAQAEVDFENDRRIHERIEQRDNGEEAPHD